MLAARRSSTPTAMPGIGLTRTGVMAYNKRCLLRSNGGKWVRYDSNGHMVKGEDYRYGGWYYFDMTTGAMAKASSTSPPTAAKRSITTSSPARWPMARDLPELRQDAYRLVSVRQDHRSHGVRGTSICVRTVANGCATTVPPARWSRDCISRTVRGITSMKPPVPWPMAARGCRNGEEWHTFDTITGRG